MDSPDTPPPAEPTSDLPDPPETKSAGMTDEQLAEARQYGRIGLACDLVDRGIDLAYLSAMAFLFARPLDAWLATCPVLNEYWSLRLVVLCVLMIIGHIGVSFPISFYSSHVVEHRFKLSKLTLGGWLLRYAKINLLNLALMPLLVVGLYWVIWTTGPWWWLAGAAASYLVNIVFGRLLPVVILPLFHKHEKLDAPELLGRIARLAEGTGLSIEGVYRQIVSNETVKANAMLAGLGSTRRVLLCDTLLEGYTPDEIEVIFGHEIGHHVYRHIQKILLIGVPVFAIGYLICDRLLRVWVTGIEGQIDYATLPVYTMPMVLLIVTVFFWVLEPLFNAISRHNERQCDRYALERTGLNDAFISGFRKLARLNKADPDPHWLEVVLFHDHPPIAERLAMAEVEEPT